jgi:hypothetical protein
MGVPIVGIGMVERRDKYLVFGEGIRPHGVVDTGRILENYPPRADIQMTDLTVTKLAIGQANIAAIRPDGPGRSRLTQSIERRRSSR